MLPLPNDISCHCGNVPQNVDLSSPDAIDEDGQVTNLQPHRLKEEPLHPLYCRRVMVTRPAARSMVTRHNSHLIPGAAAVHGVKKKNEKYLPELPPSTEFVLFVIETGGRLAKTTYKWLDSFWKDVTEERTRKLRQAAVRWLCVDVQRQLFMTNANMLYKFAHHLIAMRAED